MTTNSNADVKKIMNDSGVPDWIWQAIMTLESNGNPNAADGTGAYGLFQLQQGKGLGGSHSAAWLKDPINNASVAAPVMGKSYAAGTAKGLTGFPLLEYTAFNGGWPTTMGLSAITRDPVVGAYDKRLIDYWTKNGGNIGSSIIGSGINAGVVKPIADVLPNIGAVAQGIAGGAAYMIVILLVVGVGLFAGVKMFSNTSGKVVA